MSFGQWKERATTQKGNSSDKEAEEDCCQLTGEVVLPECDKEALRSSSLVDNEDSELTQPGSNMD